MRRSKRTPFLAATGWYRFRSVGLLSLVLGFVGCATERPTDQAGSNGVRAKAKTENVAGASLVAASNSSTPEHTGSSGEIIQTSAREESPSPALNLAPGSAVTGAIPAPAQVLPIDLPRILDLAGIENPTIAIARTAVAVAQAEREAACALLLPTLNAGTNYDYHIGNLQTSFGAIRQVTRQALYAGAGSDAIVAGTVYVPGVQIVSSLTDAIFAPQVAEHVVVTRNFDVVATNNNVLLDVGVLYYELIGAEGSLAAFRQTEQEIGEVARITSGYAKTGQGLKSDADRSQSDLLVYQQEELRAQEEVVVASAKITQLLNLDPSIRLQPLEGPVQLLALVNPAESLESLIQTALENRPEMRARTAAIAASESRYRMEHYRPFLPTISLAYSAGDFGGGSNLVSSTFSNFNGRTDIDLYAVWTLQNLGFGNMARQKGRRTEVNEAIAERTLTVNQIRDEVSEAFANAATRERDLAAARRKLQRAQQGSQRDLIRVRGLEGRPIEVLNNLRLLASARQEFVHALTAYNEAELKLFVALGQSPIPGTPVMAKDP